MIGGWGISCKITLIWMLLALTDDKSTLVQIMAWCRQATSYYLSQCWWRSLSPYGVIRPQWVKNVICKMAAILFQAGCVPRCRWSFAFVLYRTDSRFGSSQWETPLQSNGVSHWLGAKLESALLYMCVHGITFWLYYFADLLITISEASEQIQVDGTWGKQSPKDQLHEL